MARGSASFRQMVSLLLPRANSIARQRKRLAREIDDCASLFHDSRTGSNPPFMMAGGRRKNECGRRCRAIRQFDSIPIRALRSARMYSVCASANLWRQISPMSRPSRSIADAKTIQQFNTYFITRDIRRAQANDLLFYRQPCTRSAVPRHDLHRGPNQLSEAGCRKLDRLSHQTPERGLSEIRQPMRSESCCGHPSPRWRPEAGNGNFAGSIDGIHCGQSD